MWGRPPQRRCAGRRLHAQARGKGARKKARFAMITLIKDLKSSLVEHKKLSDEQENIQAKLSKAIEDNNQILDKLKEVKTVKTVESFVFYGWIVIDSIETILDQIIIF